MRRFTNADRARAIRRGVDFLYLFASDPKNFEEWGSDLLGFFYLVATKPADDELRRAARRMGRELARRWRLANHTIPSDADAETINDLIYGSDAADRLGVRDAAFKKRLRRAVRKFPAEAYFWFDPTQEPPPRDVPDQCRCGYWNERGRKICRSCRRRVRMMNRYKVWYIALIRAYMAACYGVNLGASYRDVLSWLPRMRPYRASRKTSHRDFYDTVFAVTHVVYTLNDYNAYRLSPKWLPLEFAFLKENLREALALEDAEMVGEFLDTLKSFGLANDHRLIRAGTRYLLSRQKTDGSWGDTETDDIYLNYHPTLCAVCGLLDYDWRGEKLKFPKLKPLLLGLAPD
jgi:hypothetical protein